MQVAVLGRQPKISIAELEVLLGAENITLVSQNVALIKTDQPLPQSRLGGTLKSAKLLTRLTDADLNGAFAYLQNTIPEHLHYLPDGKLQLGISVYGYKAQKNWLLKQTLNIKKVIKKSGRSVRIIENKTEALESAQVLYNKLTGPLGWEFLLIKDGSDTLLAQTTGVQNIDEYGKRDFGRPKRDAFVGMLPPKLAQIMINLAVGDQILDNKGPEISILDPFCGTGVVLQEALLMGFTALGSDISEKMVDYSTQNLQWLEAESALKNGNWNVELGDATTHHWIQPIDFVAAETYLGKPLTSLPDRRKLDEIVSEANHIAEGFLKNIAPQLKKGARLCLALPAWHLKNNEFVHLKVLDHLGDLGYNRLDLKHATQNDLIYHRTDQVVARELTILEKI